VTKQLQEGEKTLVYTLKIYIIGKLMKTCSKLNG